MFVVSFIRIESIRAVSGTTTESFLTFISSGNASDSGFSFNGSGKFLFVLLSAELQENKTKRHNEKKHFIKLHLMVIGYNMSRKSYANK